MMIRYAAAGVLSACVFCGHSLAQSSPAPPAPAGPAPASAQPANRPGAEPPRGDALPSLDDLLGLGEGAGEDGAETARLDKLLSGQEIGQAFQQAVALMDDAAKRLTGSRDVGLATQRVQEDALRKLDQLISSLDRQSQQQQQSQSQSQDDPRNSPRQRQQQQQRQQAQQEAAGSEPQESDGPTLREGALNPLLDSARTAWGALPARVREMLMQGSADRFSALYNKRTQEYYRRLAEESSGGGE